uniref:Uncharacterized protein n=1 Tax=viral metagenome TaxID=1070528 RepID=A0A6M3IRG5_9ZZZZ
MMLPLLLSSTECPYMFVFLENVFKPNVEKNFRKVCNTTGNGCPLSHGFSCQVKDELDAGLRDVPAWNLGDSPHEA